MDPKDENSQSDPARRMDPTSRELRKLRFSATLQIFSAILFIGAAFVVGSAQGFGIISAVFIALSIANIVFFLFIKRAMRALTKN